MKNPNILSFVPFKHRHPAYQAYRFAWLALDWLYPPDCGGCGRSYTRWCHRCQAQVFALTGEVCERCGGVIQIPGVCRECAARTVPYTALRSWASYQGPVRNAIRRLKYRGDMALGDILARPMIHLYQGLGWQVDMVVPVPGSLARKKMRGYNQASLLAIPIALCCGIQYRPKALRKVRDTPSQVGLSTSERRMNVRNAFLGQKELVAGKTVLVVDDVTTSGATMEACAAALLDQGASRVYGLTLARTFLDNPVIS